MMAEVSPAGPAVPEEEGYESTGVVSSGSNETITVVHPNSQESPHGSAGEDEIDAGAAEPSAPPSPPPSPSPSSADTAQPTPSTPPTLDDASAEGEEEDGDGAMQHIPAAGSMTMWMQQQQQQQQRQQMQWQQQMQQQMQYQQMAAMQAGGGGGGGGRAPMAMPGGGAGGMPGMSPAMMMHMQGGTPPAAAGQPYPGYGMMGGMMPGMMGMMPGMNPAMMAQMQQQMMMQQQHMHPDMHPGARPPFPVPADTSGGSSPQSYQYPGAEGGYLHPYPGGGEDGGMMMHPRQISPLDALLFAADQSKQPVHNAVYQYSPYGGGMPGVYRGRKPTASGGRGVQAYRAAPQGSKASKLANKKRNPKRPLTAYTCFVSDVRPQLMSSHPGKSFKIVAAMIGKMWKELSEDDSAPYRLRAKIDMDRFRREKQEQTENGDVSE